MENPTDEIQPVKSGRRSGGGEQRVYRFANGYGASVVRGQYTYGGEAGLFELAVARHVGDGDQWEITYDTPITDDVVGWLREDEVQDILRRIRDLPAVSQ